MREIALSVVILLFCCSVNAGEIKGAGAVTCGTWIESRKNGTWRTEINWILGFISSYNHNIYIGTNPDGVFGNTDANSLALWMDNFCNENPLDLVYDGTSKLLDELIERDRD